MDILKERNEIEAKYQWDLTGLFADDAAWEKALGEFDALVAATAAFEGKLDSAEPIRGYLDASTAMERQLDNLFTYASLRRSEDTRAETAQRMYARVYGKYVQAMTATAFAQPEILRLSEDELKKIAADPLLKDYTVQMAELIRQKPHTLSPAEEKLLASFGEALSAPGQISENLMDADMTFASVKDGEGKDVEVTASNFILLQNSNDRVLRENAFRSFYAGYKGHINTFAATYAGNVKAAVAEAAARHYRSSREMSMSANNIPESVYDQLVRPCTGTCPPCTATPRSESASSAWTSCTTSTSTRRWCRAWTSATHMKRLSRWCWLPSRPWVRTTRASPGPVLKTAGSTSTPTRARPAARIPRAATIPTPSS